MASRHTAAFLIAAAALSPFALRPSPQPISVILLLTTAILHAQSCITSNIISRGALFIGVVTVASCVGSFSISLNALSSVGQSLVSLVLLRFTSTLSALIPIVISTRVFSGRRYLQTALFPTLWSTSLVLITTISPLGRLGTWSPSSGMDSYVWVVKFFGIAGVDYIVGLWAVTLAFLIGDWIIGPLDDVEDRSRPNEGGGLRSHQSLLNHHNELMHTVHGGRGRASLLPVVFLLVALSVPSFFAGSTHADITTLLVSCIQPPPSENSLLKDFLAETARYAPQAKVLLWPEGAVHFETPSQRNSSMFEVLTIAKRHKVWIGVGYRERAGERDWNGLAVVGPEGIIADYRKRRIVPIAESYNTHASLTGPPIATLPLPPPRGISKGRWSPSGSGARPMPVAPSICLDFSVPFPVLAERPALLIGAAHTFHPDIGRAMYEQAKLRALELDSSLLWCDGGKGGSGVWDHTGKGEAWTGDERSRSFVWEISVPFPWDDTRSFYGWLGAALGNVVALGFFWSIFLFICIFPSQLTMIWGGLMKLTDRLHLKGNSSPSAHQPPQEEESLI